MGFAQGKSQRELNAYMAQLTRERTQAIDRWYQRLSQGEKNRMTGERARIEALRSELNGGDTQPLAPQVESTNLERFVSTFREWIASNETTMNNSDNRGLTANDRAAIRADINHWQAHLGANVEIIRRLGSSTASGARSEGGNPEASCMTIIEEQCKKPTEEAATKCDVDLNENIRNARSELGTIGNTATQMAGMAATAHANAGSTSATGAAPSTGTAQTCSMMANVAAGVNGAIAAYRMDCSSGYESCRDSCSSLLSKLRSDRNLTATSTAARQVPACQGALEGAIARAQESQTQCTRLSSRASESTAGMQGAAGNLLSGATRCIEQTVAGGLEAYCQQNPGAAVCASLAGQAVINCDDGSAASASATVCICRRNHLDSRCGNQATNQNIATNSSLGGAPLSGTPTSGQDLNAGIDGSTPISANLTPGQEVGGQKTSLPGVGSGDGLQVGEGGSGGGRAPFDPFNGPKIFGRTGGGSGQGGSGWPSGRSGAGYGTGVYGKTTSGMGNSALRDFLPNGMQDPQRGLAGSAGGILGPNVNIWEKINNRYVDHSLTKQSLLPPNYQATPQEVQRRPGQ